MNGEPLRFGAVMRKGYRTAQSTARQRAYDAARRLALNWRNRFGDQSRIAGLSGVPGTATPVTADYARRKLREVGHLKLLVHEGKVSLEYGPLQDSIEVSEKHERARGFYTDIWYAVTTQHPLFPVHEFGLVVRKDGADTHRMTLEPSRQAVSVNYATELHKGYIEALRMEGQRP